MDSTTTAEPTPAELDPYYVALLRGGPRDAVTVAVLALHQRGAVEAGRPGTMRVTTRSAGGGPPVLEKAVYAALHRPAGIKELLARPGVRRALAELRGELRDAGLLRRFPPRRPFTTRLTLRSLGKQFPLPVTRKGVQPADALFAVAFYGTPALAVLAPTFARRAGRLGPGALADKGLLPHSWGGGGGSGGGDASSCGGGGGGSD
ncbi:TIGR04222 domain-containing membrane protein [Streptomyces geranii]|uniref:TIGR04222 domain-containing membrane protein n=1 Tax=Streptomyces geranii TaxID=2058923 RepID=UPI000D02C0D4|nr:TIGR04222 domain-containing membrane protein [Streptomyces geranii]